ncbi:hypothetical protein SAMN05421734_101350 [Pelagirhabdus alkalitolerans]|uniref:Uncharacterized protein n=1 Tax=Pelagirhabdus alkalitolerans TaxID=1612202 RepID=A0A1G6GPW0_9BACI|nr:hypothetical protein [Pelagirhabdus alkalitolerans]SDB83795.1 hypothetical protein SAMN05421734_101350 [Pelagirhabdus alkalitolerans]
MKQQHETKDEHKLSSIKNFEEKYLIRSTYWFGSHFARFIAAITLAYTISFLLVAFGNKISVPWIWYVLLFMGVKEWIFIGRNSHKVKQEHKEFNETEVTMDKVRDWLLNEQQLQSVEALTFFKDHLSQSVKKHASYHISALRSISYVASLPLVFSTLNSLFSWAKDSSWLVTFLFLYIVAMFLLLNNMYVDKDMYNEIHYNNQRIHDIKNITNQLIEEKLVADKSKLDVRLKRNKERYFLT